MADEKARLTKLLALSTELLAKLHDINREMDELLGGGAGIGSQMKAIETAFDLAWCNRYAKGQRGRYVWRHTQDKPQIKRLLKTLGLSELEARIQSYIRNDDPYYAQARHNFGVFVASINSHAGAAQAPQDLELSARPVGCEHNPPCSSDQVHTKTKLREMRA